MNGEIFSPKIEELLLSIVLKYYDEVDITIINPVIFSNKSNFILFQNIKDLVESGVELDKNLLYNYLESKNLLNLVGSIEYLNYLYNLDVSKQNYNEYLNLLISAYKIRSLISITKLDPDKLSHDNINYVITSIKDKLDNLVSDNVINDTSDLQSALRSGWDKIKDKISSVGSVGVPFGVDEVDTIVGGIMPGELWYIGARPSMGKTALMLNSSLSIAKKGYKSLIFSLEMSKQSLIERILAIETGLSILNIRLGNLKQNDLDLIADAIKRIKDLPIYINASFIPDLDYIESIIRKQHNKHGLDIFYLDYIQLLAERDQDSTQELGRISRRLKLLGESLGIGICLLSQVNRDVEKRPNKRPVMSDLRQSGYLEEDADLIAFLYRDEVYNKETSTPNIIEFIIRKQRNGPIGTIPLQFIADTNKIGG